MTIQYVKKTTSKTRAIFGLTGRLPSAQLWTTTARIVADAEGEMRVYRP